MGLFDIFKKRTSNLPQSPKVTPTVREKPIGWDAIAAQEGKARRAEFVKDAAGLYPYEVLLLTYAEKYTAGKEIARFWLYDFGIDDVPGMLRSLEKRGFLSDGKPTEAGLQEIEKNEYIFYMRRNKDIGIPLSRMNQLAVAYPNRPYRDLIWGEYNEQYYEAVKTLNFSKMGSIRCEMAKFSLKEGRPNDAIVLLAEAAYYSLNSCHSTLPEYYYKILSDAGKRTAKTNDELEQLIMCRLCDLGAKIQVYSPIAVTKIVLACVNGQTEKVAYLFEVKTVRISGKPIELF